MTKRSFKAIREEMDEVDKSIDALEAKRRKLDKETRATIPLREIREALDVGPFMDQALSRYIPETEWLSLFDELQAWRRKAVLRAQAPPPQ
jgi:hypothetical protein